MLSDILELLNEHGALPVRDIALAKKVDVEALRPMLDLLERKGRIEKIEPRCKGCASACASACSDAMIYYRILPDSE